MNQDEEHLKLLSIFHYVVGAMIAIGGCFPIFHLAFGIFFLAAPDEVFEGSGDAPPEEFRRAFGAFFTVIAAGIILTIWTMAAGVVYSGRCMSARSNHTLSLIVAGILCTFMPFGTVLGVFTLIVLLRPSVKSLYERQRFGKGPQQWP